MPCTLENNAHLVCMTTLCVLSLRQSSHSNRILVLQIEKLSNQLLDSCDHFRESMGEVTDSVSLATALETSGVSALSTVPLVRTT